MSVSQFSVTKSSGGLVTPCNPTPSGTLPLSSIDQIYIKGLFIGTLHVFEHGRQPTKLIKQALSKSLLYYYPLAGRIVRQAGKEGQLEVACTGNGVWFVEATSDCRLEELNWLEDHPLKIPYEQLQPIPPEDDGMMIMIQVTEFKCGGFVIGFMSDHTIADGLGVGQFLNSLGDIARGLSEPVIKPIWCRESLPSPSKPTNPPPLPPPLTISPTKYFTLDVSLATINQLKSQFFEHTGHHCSTFDVLCAKIWQSRARAIKLDPDSDIHLVFAANARPLLKEELPSEQGYYGNCIFTVTVPAVNRMVMNGTLVEIVGLIREVKGRIPVDFAKWAKGELEEDPYKPGFGYNSVYMADWTRIGFSDVDYGWGTPRYVLPLIHNAASPVAFLLKLPEGKKGVRLIMQCVVDEHSAVFEEEMMKLNDTAEPLSPKADNSEAYKNSSTVSVLAM